MESRQVDIESMSVDSEVADAVVCSCVLNLVSNKVAVFKEIFRVLKPNGYFSISDIVLKGELPDKIKHVAEMYTGCMAGAIQKKEYLQIIEENGFMSIRVQKEQQILIPDDILSNYLSEQEINSYKQSGVGVYSITVYAEKSCCGPYALTCYKDC